MRYAIEIDNSVKEFTSLVTLAGFLRDNGIYEVKYVSNDTYKCRCRRNRWKVLINIWREYELSGETEYFTRNDETELNLLLVLLPSMYRTMRKVTKTKGAT